MKGTSRADKFQFSQNQSFDLAFVDAGFEEIIVSLQAVISNRRVLLAFTDDIKRGDDWRYISTLPKSVVNLPIYLVYLRRLKEWSNMAPHLFRPVKTIYAGYSFSPWFIKLSDLIFGNDFQKRSSKVCIKDIPGLGNHLEVHPEGWLFQDYKVNFSRLKVELLKEIQMKGGVVLNHAGISGSDGDYLITDNLGKGSSQVKVSLLNRPAGKSHIVFLAGGLPWPDFSMRVKAGRYELLMYDYNGNLAFTSEPVCDSKKLHSLISSVWTGKISDLIPENQTYGEERFLKKRLPGLLRGNVAGCIPVDSDKRPVEELMETAFDLAKQTDIGFQEFRTLYFRYGNGIDWMIDRAYEWMTTERDAEIIWSRVEAEYSKSFEWGVESDNF